MLDAGLRGLGVTRGPGKFVRHDVPIYGAALIICTSAKAWQRARREIDSLDEDPGGLASTTLAVWMPDHGPTIPNLVVFIDVARHPSESTLVNTVAHEATHAAGSLLNHLGHQLTGHDEPHAYLVGHIAELLWDRCQEVAPRQPKETA